MNKPLKFLIAVLLATGLVWAESPSERPSVQYSGELAQQSTKSSRWRSSSGAIIDITTSDSWVTVKVTPKQGQVGNWRGRWLRKYDLFEYTANGEKHTAHMVNDNIKVTKPNGQVFNWALMGVTGSGNSSQNSRYPNAGRITGRWSSTSGNVFDLSSKGAAVGVKAYMKDGRVLQANGRWTNQVSFNYQFSGFSTATATLTQDGRLRVTTQGRAATFWSKI